MQKRSWSNDEIQEFRKEHGSFIYFNRADTNFLVPKSFESEEPSTLRIRLHGFLRHLLSPLLSIRYITDNFEKNYGNFPKPVQQKLTNVRLTGTAKTTN